MGTVRYTKGSTVEVLNTKEKDLSSGSWRIAKIISGNGRTYLVRYHQFKSDTSIAEERVPRSAIRPCPPKDPSKDWAAGDLVEVFEDMSWRPARVSRVLVEDRYLLEILHSSETIIAYGGLIRIWRSWQNNQWVLVEEGPITQNGHEDIFLPEGGNLDYQWTQSGRAMKKIKLEQPTASTEEPKAKVSSKLKVIIKLGTDEDIAAGGNRLEEKLLHDQVMPYFHDRHNDSRSPASSVGSCNVRSYACNSDDDCASTSSPHLSSPGAFGRETPIPTKAGTEATYHELELQAMRSVMKEFCDSLPVSSEQEALLKKLRLVLHISDNEFSTELRNLMSK